MAKIATRQAYGDTLAQLVQENKDIVVLDADLAGSTKTSEAKKAAPERHFDMGIAEADMIGVAAGLAANGKIPFASTFAVFATGRAYDQIRNSVAYPHLNVKICATHAGLSVGEDGATHQALEDIALMRVLPGMTVVQPCDAVETAALVRAAAALQGPVYVRLGRSAVETVYPEDQPFTLGKAIVLHRGVSPVTIFATGLEVQESLQALELLKGQRVDPTLVDVSTIKPLDEETVVACASGSDLVVSVEEHSVIGGLGGAIAETLARRCPKRQLFIGVQDTFGESGRADLLLAKYGLTGDHIAEAILAALK
jgi:transketolase